MKRLFFIFTFFSEIGFSQLHFSFAGHNPVDIAGAFADFRVYDCVKEKFDSLPAPNDKKKGKGKGGKGGKRPASSGPTGDAGMDLGKVCPGFLETSLKLYGT